MSIFGSIGKALNIIDWITGKWDNLNDWFKKRKKRKIAESVRRDIERNDTSAVAKRVRAVLKKRKERADSN